MKIHEYNIINEQKRGAKIMRESANTEFKESYTPEI